MNNSVFGVRVWTSLCLGGWLSVVAVDPAAAQSASTNIISGSIGVPGEQDVYTFNVANHTHYYFDSFTNVSSIYWSLEGPAGLVVNRRQFSNSDAGSFSPLLLPAGFYRLT